MTSADVKTTFKFAHFFLTKIGKVASTLANNPQSFIWEEVCCDLIIRRLAFLSTLFVPVAYQCPIITPSASSHPENFDLASGRANYKGVPMS